MDVDGVHHELSAPFLGTKAISNQGLFAGSYSLGP